MIQPQLNIILKRFFASTATGHASNGLNWIRETWRSVSQEVPTYVRRTKVSIEKPFQLNHWFAVLSIICIGVITLLSAALLSRFLNNQVLLRDATVSQEFTDSMVLSERTWVYFSDLDKDNQQAALGEFMAKMYQMPDVVRANIFSRDGTVIWSSQKVLIGKKHGQNPELSSALSGQLIFKSGIAGDSAKEEHAHFEESEYGKRFIETYIPIWDQEHKQVVGAIELYKLPKALDVMVRKGQQLVWLIAAAAAVLLFTSLYWIVSRATKIMHEQQRQLVETRSLTMIGQTAAAVAHGIRNPLASIRASAELTLADDLDGARESAGDIIHECDRLDQWTRDLLQFSHVDVSTPEPIDINELIRDVTDEFSCSPNRKGTELKIVLTEPLPEIMANSPPIMHALGNLLSNSLDAVENEGTIEVSSSVDDMAYVVVTVRDDGHGIRGSDMDHVFKPFYSTKSGSTGLGLPLSRRILQEYGGELELENCPGGGVCATIRLPSKKVTP